MRLAIMQPYFFPYLGYFQLIRAVDAFVVYDDVNFITRGWINRNYILSQGNKLLLTLQLQGASQNLLINQITVGEKRKKILETIRHSYSRAPQFSMVFPLLEKIILQDTQGLHSFLAYQLREICEYLGLHPEWYVSSTLGKDNTLRGKEKILAICKELNASYYFNAPGGMTLYDKEEFSEQGIELSFVRPNNIEYRQFNNEFVPNLSIIDLMMFNDKEQCVKLLEEYQLV